MGSGGFYFRPILIGFITVIMIVLGLSLFFTMLLYFTSIMERSIEWLILPSTLIALVIGGVIAGYRSGHKGWYFGGTTGVLFALLSWLISYLGYDSIVSMKGMTIYLTYILLATIGGMIGVNMSPHRHA